MTWAEDLQAIAAGKRAPIPYDAHMGFRLVSWSPEGAIVEADVDGRFANPTGVLHGGVLMGLADSAMGLTVTGLLAEGQAGTNTDLQMRFLRPTKGGGRLTATARVVRQGRRTLVLECDVVDSAGKLVARASSSFLVLDATGFAQG
ncbi:MAG TPA: PaaI family thioesterase [Candidatus Thermoplasmatota archaeon]|nr:PaaI family thioesterase [Candidatus Thermoplasmatota archaeon]